MLQDFRNTFEKRTGEKREAFQPNGLVRPIGVQLIGQQGYTKEEGGVKIPGIEYLPVMYGLRDRSNHSNAVGVYFPNSIYI